jgi:hypothetical protein
MGTPTTELLIIWVNTSIATEPDGKRGRIVGSARDMGKLLDESSTNMVPNPGYQIGYLSLSGTMLS